MGRLLSFLLWPKMVTVYGKASLFSFKVLESKMPQAGVESTSWKSVARAFSPYTVLGIFPGHLLGGVRFVKGYPWVVDSSLMPRTQNGTNSLSLSSSSKRLMSQILRPEKKNKKLDQESISLSSERDENRAMRLPSFPD
ncbi:hypothetical protein VNO77_14997 [Canavalia gladiata]|uniref:Uncharacterized protein n=1 Tax=Canavalia gladiata TaxID=3824 RepID=A0AAN9LYL1_CANGL